MSEDTQLVWAEGIKVDEAISLHIKNERIDSCLVEDLLCLVEMVERGNVINFELKETTLDVESPTALLQRLLEQEASIANVAVLLKELCSGNDEIIVRGEPIDSEFEDCPRDFGALAKTRGVDEDLRVSGGSVFRQNLECLLLGVEICGRSEEKRHCSRVEWLGVCESTFKDGRRIVKPLAF
jgi:hypothetical protein